MKNLSRNTVFLSLMVAVSLIILAAGELSNAKASAPAPVSGNISYVKVKEIVLASPPIELDAITGEVVDTGVYIKSITTYQPRIVSARTTSFNPNKPLNRKAMLSTVASEQNQWGGKSITSKLRKAKFNANTVNGNKQGLLQVTRKQWEKTYKRIPRKVVQQKVRVIKAPSYKITVWSDGREEREVIRQVALKERMNKVGYLNKNATPFNAWAAIRTGQIIAANALETVNQTNPDNTSNHLGETVEVG